MGPSHSLSLSLSRSSLQLLAASCQSLSLSLSSLLKKRRKKKSPWYPGIFFPGTPEIFFFLRVTRKKKFQKKNQKKKIGAKFGAPQTSTHTIEGLKPGPETHWSFSFLVEPEDQKPLRGGPCGSGGGTVFGALYEARGKKKTSPSGEAKSPSEEIF